ncbi:cupredoxin domain-containing protein [Halovivax gelatinilyticus]|uniref:cupredoxin domain-containing protein n=1 Tax=Halovivax gelatinilyticus TaxID=2961597 RepID=UPI0020CA3B16|nr:plastocyanin/azurin family copper-binding protein [Halovivax gelatinilyticus]
MTPERHPTRRRALKLAGVASASVLLAGCPDDDDDTDDVDDGEEGPPEPDDEEPEDDTEDPEDDAEDPDDDDEDDDTGNGFEIEPDTQIEFDGQTEGWIGIAPDDIEGEENPTLVLEEGESYEIGWTEGDGATHNIEIRDDDGEVVDDLETDFTDSPDDDQWLEFEASDEMTTYVCEPHETTMVGDIEVE